MHRSNVGRVRPVDWHAYPQRDVDEQPASTSTDRPSTARLTVRHAEASGTHAQNPSSYEAFYQRTRHLAEVWSRIGECDPSLEIADRLLHDIEEADDRGALTRQQYGKLRRRIARVLNPDRTLMDSESRTAPMTRAEALDRRALQPLHSLQDATAAGPSGASPAAGPSGASPAAPVEQESSVEEMTDLMSQLCASFEEIENLLDELDEEAVDADARSIGSDREFRVDRSDDSAFDRNRR